MIEKAISRLLKTGVLISVSFLLIGAFLLIIEPKEIPFDITYSYTNGLSFEQFFADLFALKSASYLLLGTFFLLLTPVARITLSFLLFLKIKNYPFVLICGFSLVVILCSILVKLLH